MAKATEACAYPHLAMGSIGRPRLSAKARVLHAYPGAQPQRWPASVDRSRRVRIHAADGRVVGIGDSTLQAWGDASRRLQSTRK